MSDERREAVESEEVIRERLAKYTRVLHHTGVFLDSQYFNLGKKTIPLYNAMEDQWRTLTPEDFAYNATVINPDGSEVNQ